MRGALFAFAMVESKAALRRIGRPPRVIFEDLRQTAGHVICRGSTPGRPRREPLNPAGV
jgi:hypothetical protein